MRSVQPVATLISTPRFEGDLHCDICGLTAEQFEQTFTQKLTGKIVKNPNPKERSYSMDEEIDELVRGLDRSLDLEVRRANFDRLIGLGERAVPALLRHLQSEDQDRRATACSVLAQMRYPQVVESLVALFRDSNDVEVRWRAAYALGKLGDRRSVEALIAAITDPSPLVRASAAEALRGFSEPRVVAALISALRDSDWEVRQGAASSLGVLRAAAAADSLV